MSGGAGALELVRAALGGSRCWVVGGAVRDELIGAPPSTDLDLVIDGDVAAAARALARAARGVAFSLSDDFGAWRVVGPRHAWQADLNPLRGGSLDADLRLRDFTINAIARPLAGGERFDPLGGAEDLAARRLRLVGASAIADDPLRALRLVRLACELDLEPDAAARAAAIAGADGLGAISSERIYGELRRIIAADSVVRGVRLLLELRAAEVILPELVALRGVEQSRYHHLDVLDHTVAVLECAVALAREPGVVLGEQHDGELRSLLAAPLADELTRGDALRLGALLHDIAKAHTRAVWPDGRVGFPGHDVAGAEVAREILARLRAAERVRAHVAALTRHHLRLGFLVHRAPLARRELYGYLDACDAVSADVTLLSVADRLATRGAGAEEAIERHLALARTVIGPGATPIARASSSPRIRAAGRPSRCHASAGPIIGELLAEIAEGSFAGELRSAEDAIAFAAARIA